MAVMDEFREERESIKTAPARVKWQYFKDYYLMWVLGGLALVIVVVSFIVSILRQKDTVFYAALVNLSPRETAESAVTETFSGQSLEDPRHQQIVVDTGNLAMMDSTCSIEIQSVRGVKNVLFGGEGLFNTVVTGPGKVTLQTMPLSTFANTLRPYFPTSGS